METEMTIRQVARETGLSEHTLRYYERIGLIAPISRAPNGHRRYSGDDVGWITFLMRLRATGMPISRMKQYSDLQRQGDATLDVSLIAPHRCELVERRSPRNLTHITIAF